MTLYDAGRGNLTIEQRMAFLTQDIIALERSAIAAPPRDVLQRRGPAARAYFDDAHDRGNMIGWIRGTLTMWEKMGTEDMERRLSRDVKTTLADWLTKIESESAAFRAGGRVAAKEHRRLREAAGRAGR